MIPGFEKIEDITDAPGLYQGQEIFNSGPRDLLNLVILARLLVKSPVYWDMDRQNTTHP